MTRDPSTWNGTPGAWFLGAERRQTWGLDDQQLLELIEGNYQDVESDQERVSSPLIAMTGAYEKADSAAGSTGEKEKEFGAYGYDARPKWFQTDHVFVPQRLWEHRDDQLSKRLREKGRLAWVHAMREGRVGFDRGPAVTHNPIGPELHASRPKVGKNAAADGTAEVAALADQMIALVNVPDAGDEVPDHGHSCGANLDSGEMCTRLHTSGRSMVVRWLDGEVVPTLSPSRIPESMLGDPEATRRMRAMALTWWTSAYYQAICKRDGYRLLTLHNLAGDEPRSRRRGIEPDALEVAWGISKPKLSRLQSLWRRLRGWRRPGTAQGVAIDGDVVSKLSAFTPGQYARLQHFEVIREPGLRTAPTNKRLFDLALAVEEVKGDTASQLKRRSRKSLRAISALAVALALILYERGVLQFEGVGGLIITLIATLAIGVPWGELAALVKLSGVRLQATMRLRREV